MIKATNFNFIPLVEYLKSVPYELVHTKLYTTAELYEGYRPELPESEQNYYDLRVYKHFMATGKLPKSIDEAQKAIDKLWDEGVINEETIEQWGEEHMRTPYGYEAHRS